MAKKIDKQALRQKIQELQIDNSLKSELLAAISEQKTFGLVWEDRDEEAQEILRDSIPVFREVTDCRIISNDQDAPNHIVIEADNLHALTALTYTHEGKFDAIYIDPPYNSGAKDWKYNNDYVDREDAYKHSKWLCMINHRLKIAKRLLNPDNSVLIVTIDEKEYLHLGCMLEDMFPDAKIQMITSVINPSGTMRGDEFSRVEEYLFICRFGCSAIIKTEENMLGNDDASSKTRLWYPFTRSNWLRAVKNLQFFPIYIDEVTKKIVAIGDSMEQNRKQEDFPQIDGAIAVFPVRDNGEEASWGAVPSTARKWAEKGTLRVGDFDKKTGRWSIQYIRTSWQEKIDSGEIPVSGKRSDGSLDIERAHNVYHAVSPKSVWNKKTHNATDYGTYLIQDIFHDKRFTYPKSLYAVMDSLRFFVANNPNAKILDFFAGSGTTLHATMMLNKEDNGHRQCILVSNDENNICEDVTYERNKRVIEGYTKNNGDFVEGLHGNNLRFYKTEFVNRENTSTNRRALMSASIGLLCIKENIFNESETFVGRKFKKSVLRYFEEGDKQMLVIFDERVISLIIPMIAEIAKKESPMKVFVFSDGQYAYEDEFHEVMPLIDLCALPDAIYQALNNVLPEQQYSEEMIAEFNEEEAEAALADTYNYKVEEGDAL